MLGSAYFKSFLGGIQSNRRAKGRVFKKLVVLESDDWGAIRMPSADALRSFENSGMDLSKSLYKVDSLASAEDLDALFNTLLSVKNIHGECPVLTANAIMANPDFDRIKASGFQEYFFEPFTETLKKYPQHQSNLEIWKQGIQENLFQPQLHGREHLNIVRWMKALQAGDPQVRFAFDLGSTYSGKADYAFMEAYDWNEAHEVKLHSKIITEGMEIFERTFGFRSASFIAPCYNWDPALEPTLSKLGIEWIQGISSQLAPTGSFDKYQSIQHGFGDRNAFGSRYNIRNVFFEPVTDPYKDWTDPAMARIQAAFLFNKPAVISTHRVNYVGFIQPKNRDNGLRQLKLLLNRIVKRWPEVKFISTDQLSHYI